MVVFQSTNAPGYHLNETRRDGFGFFVGMKYFLDLRLLLTKMSIHLNLITVWSLIQSGNGWNFRNM